MKLSEQQLLNWLRLLRTDSIGPKSFQKLINQFGGAAEALAALPDISRRAGRAITPAPEADIQREITTARRMGARFVALGESDYPALLARIDAAPPVIAVLGRLPPSQSATVAIVGSRNASLTGLKMTERLAIGLGRHGYWVASGLARGIDTRAHDASLSTGTVAVLAGGLDKLYPQENRGLFERIAGEGGIVSEMPFGWEPRGRDFPRRNRIISGISLGVIVVEANHKSGSLITANFAGDQGRQVFAVPGSPLDPRSEGPNALIRTGATLVTSADDIHEDVQRQHERGPDQLSIFDTARPDAMPLWDEAEWLEGSPQPATVEAHQPTGGWREPPAPVLRDQVLAKLTFAPVDVDDLTRELGSSARDISITLLVLETEGLIERRPGNSVVMRPK
jgi:DNA processing protein